MIARPDLASFVRRRRLELRMTQRDAAARAGVSLATWQTVERGRETRFAELTLSRVAHGLGVVLDDLEDTGPHPGVPAGAGDRPPGPPSPIAPTSGDDDPEQAIAALVDQLRRLAAVSDDTFRVVHGQAADAAAHFLRVLGDGRR